MKKLVPAAALVLLAGCAAQPAPPEGASILLEGQGGKAVLRGGRCWIVPSPYGGIPRCDSGPERPQPRNGPPAQEHQQKEKRL